MDEELAIALRALDRRGDHIAGPQPELAGLARHAAEHGAVDLGVAHDPALRLASAGFELRLHERDDRPRAVAERRPDRPEHEPERDERDVDDREVDRLRQRRRREVAGVRALERYDAVVRPEALGQLPP